MSETGTRKVVIAGGGVAALEAALALRAHAADLVSVELLAPDPRFHYQPLSVAAPFGLGEVVELELDELAATLGARRTPAGLTGVDAWRHVAHTTTNAEVPYDFLLVACGALPMPAVPGATTFRGAADSQKVGRVLDEIGAGDVRSLAFVIPWGAVWSLPAYELALLTAARLAERGIRDVELTVVTPEAEPLQLFGPPAGAAIRDLLATSGVALRTDAYAGGFADGRLSLTPGPDLAVDGVLALPRLEGAPLDGIPQTLSGFVPVDEHGRVVGVDDVYAAGDITSFTVKQGGIATQQADAAAEAMAKAAGAALEPAPFRPVLRGLLLTGREPRYLRRELDETTEHEPVAAYEALWWPPAKIVGRYLAPFLAELSGKEAPDELPSTAADVLPVEIALSAEAASRLSTSRFPIALTSEAGESHIDDVMDRDPVVVSADHTLDAVAARLVQRGVTAAAVMGADRLLGILTLSDVVRASAARVQPHEAPVRLWMTAEPVTVPPDWPASAAALLMSEYGIHHLPVVEGERVVGMLELEHVQKAALAGVGVEGTGDE